MGISIGAISSVFLPFIHRPAKTTPYCLLQPQYLPSFGTFAAPPDPYASVALATVALGLFY
jgi:hypothetical protein